ncbi:MAG: TIGR04372 family glycosyltransferase [Candidatus Omnitrophota bacterium]
MISLNKFFIKLIGRLFPSSENHLARNNVGEAIPKIPLLSRLNPFGKYILLTPFEYAIGNAAEHIFYGALTAKIKSKTLILIVRQPGILRRLLPKRIRGVITNDEIFKVKSEGLIVPADHPISKFIGMLLDIIFIPLRLTDVVCRKIFRKNFGLFLRIPSLGHNIVFNPNKYKTFDWKKVDCYKWENVLTEGVPISIASEKEDAAGKIREVMGIPRDAWYVTLHVREKGFYNEPESRGGYRSANILNYLDAIKHITGQGGWVVRLGDKTMTPLPAMERLIDYPHTGYKSNLMDLYLIKNCRLYVGMDSGIWDVAHMFQVNNVMANVTGWLLAAPPKYGDLQIIKHYYSKSRGRLLGVRECLEEPPSINYHYGENVPDHEKSDYIVFENTPREIKGLVREKLSQGPCFSYSELQKLFVEKRQEQMKRWLCEDAFLKNSTMQSYRLSTRYYYKGTLSQQFLEDNWEYGGYLEALTTKLRKNNLLCSLP